MRLSPTNHRYCGWRESTKLTSFTKSAVGDLADYYNRLDVTTELGSDFEDDIAVLMENIAAIQAARYLLDGIRRRNIG